jgi:hypothetical protein
MHSYHVYGVPVHSSIKFWEFSDASPGEPSERWASLRQGAVPQSLEGGFWLTDWIEVRGTECLFHVRDKGRFLVTNGDSILVDLESPDLAEDIKPYLLICGFATLAHQRRMIPLHVSALRSPQGIYLFAGESGAGKSTMAATLNARFGWKILCDDLAVLDTEGLRAGEGEAMLHFGMNKMKLWDDAAQRLGIATDGVLRDYFRPHKLHVPVAPSSPAFFAEVKAIVTLRWGEPQVAKQTPAHAFGALMNSIYPPMLVPAIGDVRTIREVLLVLSAGVSAIDFQRNRDGDEHDIANLCKALATCK